MDEKTIDRFWAKVDRDGPVPPHRPELGPCWVWTAGSCPGGYGNFQLDGRTQNAHRIAWRIQHGAIHDGLCVLHHCDNRPCVRGSHLFLGTKGENNADRDAKGRHVAVPGELHGCSKLTEADVIAIRSRYAAGGISQRKIGEEFGVGQQQICKILNRQRWSSVQR